MLSPSNSTFPYYYKNGIIHALKLSSYYKDEESVIQLIKEEKAFILNQNTVSVFWIDFYFTSLSKKILIEFIDFLESVSVKMKKCAIVGLTFTNRIKVKYYLANSNKINILLNYFKDPEEAKSWLIGK